MKTGRSPSRQLATPWTAGVLMGSIALGAGWMASGNPWQAVVVVGAITGVVGYFTQRGSRSRSERAEQ